MLALPLTAWAAPGLPKGWDQNPYGAWIDKVWDSAVLPACVPKEIPGVQVEQTTWKTPAHETMSNRNEVGRMQFADSRFEKWGLGFDCKEEQAAAFLKALTDNGFFGGQINDSSGFTEHAYVGNGYYAYARVSTNYMGSALQAGFNQNVIFSITPIIHQLPKSFNSWPLPQVGAALEPYNDWAVQYWDEKIDDYGNAKWDLQADKGALPAKNWTAWFDYFGVSNDQAKAYAKELEAAGWKITYQSEDDGQYYCQLQKDKLWAALFFDGAFYLRVGFSDVAESLSY